MNRSLTSVPLAACCQCSSRASTGGKAASGTKLIGTKLSVTLLFLAGFLLLGGCGYSQAGGDSNKAQTGYHWNSLYREDIQTVAVPIFTNKDFRRGVEFRLTEAVIKQLELHAPYKVVPKERADTILEGEVVSVKVGTLSKDFYTNLPREQLVTVTVDLTWKDLRTGKILLQRHGLQQEGVYNPPLGEGEFVGTQQAIERFALVIVHEMQADW